MDKSSKKNVVKKKATHTSLEVCKRKNDTETKLEVPAYHLRELEAPANL
jgi:hypothetical protein